MAMRWGKLYKGTPAEHALEPAVAALGLAYRTQLPGYLYGFRYFPDFFIPQLGVVIEVDDASHNRKAKQEEDAERTAALAARGYRVVRCTNEEALNDPHGTVQGLMRQLRISDADIASAKRKALAACLPQPGKCSRKAKGTQRSNRRGSGSQRVARRPQARANVDRGNQPGQAPTLMPPLAHALQPSGCLLDECGLCNKALDFEGY